MSQGLKYGPANDQKIYLFKNGEICFDLPSEK